MKRLVLFSLAATILVPAGALAQESSHDYPEATYEAGVATTMSSAGRDERRRYRNYRRLERGGMVPHYWWGPGFQIMEWSSYGLSQPVHGHRWVRYYDDALLIDSHGRIVDARYDMDWAQYAGWSYDSYGIPIYGSAHVGTYAHHGSGYGGYASPGAYGYAGYGYGGAWVTETTTTYADCCCAEEAVYEQPYVAPPPPPPPPPPPRAGERG
jgi:Ni/Co efflux regulator RcnB